MKQDDLNILLTYNNKDTNNITVIDTKPYMANTTNSFILSSQQLSAALCNFIVQVVTIDSIIVSTRNVTCPFITPTPVTPTSSSSKKHYCNN